MKLPLAVVGVLVLTIACLGGCAAEKASAGTVTVTATDSTCKLSATSLKAGARTFKVTNHGSKVTEFYIYARGDSIEGEVENVGPGLSRSLTVDLVKGTYEAACKPGMKGDGIRQRISVTGRAAESLSDSDALKASAERYERYIASESDQLVSKTTDFVDAVKSGNTDEAKTLYPEARTHWERIEPVAEIFGDLDPLTDGREPDAKAEKRDFTGWHRIEKQLWVEGNTDGMGKYADELLANIKKVVALGAKKPLTALQLAQGSKALLDEVATGKITGEEDVFSHTDLWDFQANVDGSKAAIGALRPVIEEHDRPLLLTIDRRFARLDAEMDRHRKADGSWTLYDQLSDADIKKLSDAVGALGEPISKVAAVVASST